VSTATGSFQRRAAKADMEGVSPTTSEASCEPTDMHWSATNAMTIDVEDYFHVEAFASTIDRKDWDHLPQRVERNTERILDILAESDAQATFFVLGWIAQRHPALVRRIVADGHELASHGFNHMRIDRLSPEEFRADVQQSKRVLEDASGVAVRGYRAPTFSISRNSTWAHAILLEEGYRYSSSVYPRKHDLYGSPGAPRTPFAPLPGFVEVPLTTIRIFRVDVPASGGGYFRLFPYRLTRWLVDRANSANGAPAVFYLHPWEVDPDQPRQHHAPLLSRFRHYLNLGLTERRLGYLLNDFRWARMDRLFLVDRAEPVPLIASWMDPKPRSR
jgi:polysaccharide deacetylase family protein (PEP-CTERM system associated)